MQTQHNGSVAFDTLIAVQDLLSWDSYKKFLKDVKISSPEVHAHNLTYFPVSPSSNTEFTSKFLKRLNYKAIKYWLNLSLTSTLLLQWLQGDWE